MTFLLDTSTDTWIGIVSDGTISCQGLSGCDGKKLWIDGSYFNASYFSTIADINIQSGHRFVFLVMLVFL
jgi:hypothetical protein